MQTLDSYVAAAQLSDRRAAAATARAARRARKLPAASTDERLVLRRAAAEDELSLARLARLDSAPRPSGPMLVAEIDGEAPRRRPAAVAGARSPTRSLPRPTSSTSSRRGSS